MRERPAARVPEEDADPREHEHPAGSRDHLAAVAEQRDRFLQRRHRLPRAPAVLRGLAEPGEDLGSLWMVRWREGQRPLEVPECRGGVEPERPFTRQDEEPPRGSFEFTDAVDLPRHVGQIERGGVVVGEDVGEVLDAVGGPRLQPACRGDVAGGTGRSWAAARRRRRGRARARRRTRPRPRSTSVGRPHQLLARERAKRLDDLAGIAFAHLGDRPGPEDLADDRRIREQRLRVGREGVQAGGDQRLDRIGERNLGALAQFPAGTRRSSRSRSFSRRTNSSA